MVIALSILTSSGFSLKGPHAPYHGADKDEQTPSNCPADVILIDPPVSNPRMDSMTGVIGWLLATLRHVGIVSVGTKALER